MSQLQVKQLLLVSIMFVICQAELAHHPECLTVNIECPVEYNSDKNTVSITDCSMKILRRSAFDQSGECIESLVLKNNHIEEIEPRTFESLSKLKQLDLSNNSIAKLSPETFQGAFTVTALNLSFNNIRAIEKDTFLNLTQLTHLDLSHNEIEDIEKEGFAGLKLLKSLDLSYNKFKTLGTKQNKLPVRVRNSFLSMFVSIESIDLSHNSISSMGPISPTAFIKKLNLSENQLKTWRYDTFISVEELDCSRNNISEVFFGSKPPRTKLKVVDLSYNNIRDLPYTEMETTSIEILRLAHNLAGCYQERKFQDYFLKIGVNFVGTSTCSNVPDKNEDESIAKFDDGENMVKLKEDDSSFNQNTENTFVENKSVAPKTSINWMTILFVLICTSITRNRLFS